jgi:hypothetical protein
LFLDAGCADTKRLTLSLLELWVLLVNHIQLALSAYNLAVG